MTKNSLQNSIITPQAYHFYTLYEDGQNPLPGKGGGAEER
jgi:hypothetical protein